MAITVTATATSAFTNGINCQVMVLTGASATQNGATGFSAAAYQASVTPHATGSRIYGALLDDSAFTANGSTTIFGSTVSGGISYASCKSTGTTTASTPVTIGASAPSHVDGGCALLEILGTTTEDGSAPADAIATGATTVTTASFSPPAGSLLVALVEALVDLGSGGSVAVHDSSSLTWTQQVNCGGTDGYAGVWTAQVAGGTTVTIAGTASAVAAGTASGATTKPVSAARPAVAAGSASGASTKPVSAARPAVASFTASASVGPPTITIAGDASAVAARTAAGTTSKPAAAARPAVAGRSAAGATSKPVSGSRPAVAAITASATVGAVIPSVVQYVTGGGMPDYGMSSTPISTTDGNGIVVYAGWDLHASPTTGVVPALYVSDSAGNFWYHLGTSPAGGYGSRCSIWCCPNARAVSWVSASLTAFASSLAYLVVEIENFPDFAVQDVEADGFVNAAIPSLQAFTATGTHKWLAQPGVTSVSVQAWGGGGGGGGGTSGGGVSADAKGAGGGGGGEYAAEPTLAVTPGNTYSYTIGKGGSPGTIGLNVNPGNGGSGTSTTFAGDSVTVTAHGGHGGVVAGAGGAGGSGSTNTTHHNGGAGGSYTSVEHGMGGGGSGGPSSAGVSVPANSKTAAIPVTDGGPGGTGGSSVSPYYAYPPLSLPGGGGGGGGSDKNSSGTGGGGQGGQVVLSYSVSSPVSLSLSATTTTADIAFTMIAAGAGDMTLSSGPAGWTSISGVTVGGANPDGMTTFCYWQPSVSAATALTPSYTVTPDISLSGIVTTVQSSPATPSQPNPNFPAIKVEIAEGFQPGDPSAIPPSWTDITSYCMGKNGDAFITVTYGQQYELATPEAGEMVIGVNNLTGAFTPGNPQSPFFPFIVLGMPVRVSAYWDGSWYQIGYGYVERWPQEWPDLPQWGLSKLTCTDSIAVLTSATMPSALQGAILGDGPYAYFPCGEQYLTYINGLTPESGNLESYSTAEAAGLIASNASRTNQRAGMYCDSTGSVLGPGGSSPAPMETGDALNLFGDQGTGCGTSQISGSVSYSAPVSGPGMIYADPNMPDPTNPDGVTVELWFVYSFPDTSGQGCTLFQAFGPSPSCYWPTSLITPTSAGPVSFSVRLNSGGNVIQLQFGSSQVSAGTFTPSANPQQLVLAFPPTGSTGLQVYLNGALLDTVSLSGKPITPWVATVLGPATYAYSASSLVQNYVTGHLVLYPYTLAAARVADHYTTGAQGASGLDVSAGAGSILSWGYLGIPRGGPVNFGPGNYLVSDGVEMGAFYNVGGSSAADALNAAILSDGGMMYAAPSGVLTVMPRWALFDQAPLVTFGDATDGSQVPFLQGQAFDYDNTYLYDVVSVQRSNGPTESITAIAQDTASQMAYFTRSALQQQISTTSDLDAYTLSEWELGQYAQPQIRVRNLTVDAASNPAAAFPVILPATVSNVADVSRSPLGGVPITGSFLIQRVSHTIGPSLWNVAYQISPYVALGAVLGLDTAGFNVIGTNTLA